MPRSTRYTTRQRAAVLACLKERTGQYLGVQDVADAVKKLGVSVGLTTIYRNLDTLVEEGAVRKFVVDKNSAAVYEYLDDPHTEEFHVKCRACGTLFHLRCDDAGTHGGGAFRPPARRPRRRARLPKFRYSRALQGLPGKGRCRKSRSSRPNHRKRLTNSAARLQLAHRLLDERMAERSVFMGTALLPHPFLSVTKTGLKAALRSQAPEDGSSSKRSRASFMGQNFGPHMEQKCASRAPEPESVSS